VNQPSFSHHQVTKFILENTDQHTDIAIGAFVWNEGTVKPVLNDLENNHFPGRIILGGPQVSYVKKEKELERFYPQATTFIRGYAEKALVELMQSDSTTLPQTIMIGTLCKHIGFRPNSIKNKAFLCS
jgi:radical SAM superfamily enzyme YgiQ (UPF0313 family)